MERLLVIIISWNRPQFLRRLLASLFPQLDGLPHDVVVIDNGSDAETLSVIREDSRLAGCHAFPENRGLNVAIELALTKFYTPAHRWVLVSDADMEYLRPLSLGVSFLQAHRRIGAVSYQHSPEHPVMSEHTWQDEIWPIKATERGCALLFRRETLERMRPLPSEKLTDFDWWVIRDAPAALQRRDESIAVLAGGARHLGWRAGDSTWQTIEIPEYPTNRI